MADENTNIDVLSLEDFRRTLDSRLAQAETALGALTDPLKIDTEPPLGTFDDARRLSGDHATRLSDAVTRVNRLITAITAAQTATDTILSNYRTAEARNNANSTDIANVLGDVQVALNGVVNA